MITTPRRPGRPRVADPETVSAIGLELISQQGWTATTMNQIARACGVSSPTLFRYFPTKAAMLWHGMDENERLFRAAFAARSADEPAVDSIVDAYVSMLANTQHLPLLKARMAVISRDHDAAQATWPTHEHWRHLVTSFAAESRHVEPSSLEARAIGASIWAMLWTAITEWAVSDDEDPAAFVDVARAYVACAID